MKRRINTAPRWTTTVCADTCDGCGGLIAAGARAYFYPLTTTLYCEPCGIHAAQENAHAEASR